MNKASEKIAFLESVDDMIEYAKGKIDEIGEMNQSDYHITRMKAYETIITKLEKLV